MKPRARPATAPAREGQIADAATAFRLLRDILLREPELVEEVRRAGTSDGMAEALARIGAVRGIPTDAAELRGYVARLANAPPAQPLGDEVLEGMAGGVGSGRAVAGSDFLDAVLAGIYGAGTRRAGP